VTLDISATLLKGSDAIRSEIGVDRSALIKVWLHERVQQEKSRPRQSIGRDPALSRRHLEHLALE
jgi:hypothetical protein